MPFGYAKRNQMRVVVRVFVTRVTLPSTKRREGLGGITSVALDDLLNNDDDGRMMIMKE